MHEPAKIDPTAVFDDGALHVLLGLTATSIAKARRTGNLRFSRKGQRILYLGQWVLDWIAAEGNESAVRDAT